MGLVRKSGPFGVDVTQIDTVQQFDLGDEYECIDPENQEWKRYIYCTYYGAKTDGSVYILDDNDYIVQEGIETTSDSIAPVDLVVPDETIASPTSGAYFTWFQSAGTFDKVSVLSACAANVELYNSGTAGAVDDAAGKLIPGLKNIESVATSATTKKCFCASDLCLPSDA